MGDMGEIFREMEAIAKTRRAARNIRNMKILQDSGVEFESKNDGAILLFRGVPGWTVTYYPTKGWWYIPEMNAKGRGPADLFLAWYARAIEIKKREERENG